MTMAGTPAAARPTIGIVTVTYNSAAFLDEFVRCCATLQGPSFRVYCIDNASADDTPQRLRALDEPWLALTLNARNVGVAEGNNQGIVQALDDGCEWVLLLNNDTEFASDLVTRLLDACGRNGWRTVVPKMYFDRPPGRVWYGGGGFNPRRGYTGFHVDVGAPDDGRFDRVGTVDYAPTCCMLVHRSVFDEVGLMDESYFVYFDDTDFCWRLKQRGIPIGYWPQATLVHKVGGSTGGVNSPFTARITARNRLYYLRKHFGSGAARLWMLVFLPYYAVRYLVRQWNPACFKASLEGSFAYRSLTPREPSRHG